MLNNINKNPNSITWKTCSTTLSRIQTPKQERRHELCKEGKNQCKQQLCKHINAKVNEICSNLEPLEVEIRAKN
jgi:hypothetical protein